LRQLVNNNNNDSSNTCSVYLIWELVVQAPVTIWYENWWCKHQWLFDIWTGGANTPDYLIWKLAVQTPVTISPTDTEGILRAAGHDTTRHRVKNTSDHVRQFRTTFEQYYCLYGVTCDAKLKLLSFITIVAGVQKHLLSLFCDAWLSHLHNNTGGSSMTRQDLFEEVYIYIYRFNPFAHGLLSINVSIFGVESSKWTPTWHWYDFLYAVRVHKLCLKLRITVLCKNWTLQPKVCKHHFWGLEAQYSWVFKDWYVKVMLVKLKMKHTERMVFSQTTE
jgi:hypothetical protein